MTRWLAILLLLVAGALVWTVINQRHGATTSSTDARRAAQPRTVQPREDLPAAEKRMTTLFREASPSVVHITSIETRRSRLKLDVLDIPQGTGSGFVWSEDGYIVTNFHVIQHADKAQVTLSDNTVFEAKIVGVAPNKDLAVLKIKSPQKLRPLPVGNSSVLEVGQTVLAIGNPFGLDQTLTTGVISGLGREIKSVTKRPIYDVIQTDAPINPGNSGGPLLDTSGAIIGVNTAIYSPSGAYAGIGFAVPIDTVNLTVPQLISKGRLVRPGLGIHIGTDALARQLNMEGVLVIDVQPGSAAGKAGLKGTTGGAAGRWILGDAIVGIDNKAIKTSSDLFRVLDQHKVGDEVTLVLEHNGHRRETRITLQALP